MIDINKANLIKLDAEYIPYIREFDCLNDDENFIGFKAKKIRKFKAHSENLNKFLKEKALSEQEEGLSTTYILLYEEQIIGFISTCSDSITLGKEEKAEENFPYQVLPAIKIAKLAIDKRFQNMGLGEFLIRSIIGFSITIRDFTGVKFITVDCYEHRVPYYNKQGFIVNIIQKENRESDNPLSLRLNIDKFLETLEV